MTEKNLQFSKLPYFKAWQSDQNRQKRISNSPYLPIVGDNQRTQIKSLLESPKRGERNNDQDCPNFPPPKLENRYSRTVHMIFWSIKEKKLVDKQWQNSFTVEWILLESWSNDERSLSSGNVIFYYAFHTGHKGPRIPTHTCAPDMTLSSCHAYFINQCPSIYCP